MFSFIHPSDDLALKFHFVGGAAIGFHRYFGPKRPIFVQKNRYYSFRKILLRNIQNKISQNASNTAAPVINGSSGAPKI